MYVCMVAILFCICALFFAVHMLVHRVDFIFHAKLHYKQIVYYNVVKDIVW